MVKVKMLRQRSGAWFSGSATIVWPRAGEIIELPEVLAEEVIASGDGEWVSAPKKAAAPAATRRKAVRSRRETRG